MTVYICENGEQKYSYTDVLKVEHDEGSYIITFKENNEIKKHRYIDRYELRLLTESTIYNFDFNLVERLRHKAASERGQHMGHMNTRESEGSKK